MELDARLYSAAQVRELDRRAIETQRIPGYTLMRRAAAACWREASRRWHALERIAVICGGGNNGGDGYEIARLARAEGCEVVLLQVGAPPLRGDAVTAREAWLADGGRLLGFDADKLKGAQLIFDALFGTGLSRAVDGDALRAIDAMAAARAAGAAIVAVDIPSGLSADSGAVLGRAVVADLTVSFIGLKLGLLCGEGPDHCGELSFDSLDVPAAVYEGLEPAATRLDRRDIAAALPRRARTAHKGSSGHVLIVGGAPGTGGAALLAARAALRAGAGLVSLATHPAHAAALLAAQPEIMVAGVETAEALRPLVERATVVAVGPGLGREPWGRMLWQALRGLRRPRVVDADALNLLAETPQHDEHWILTPHPGEAARLLGNSSAEVQRDRPAAVRALAQRYGGVVVLKGAGTLVQGEQLALCGDGNPGMAVGGMGDALTGIVAACVAQGMALQKAAQIGVLVHALAGDRAAVEGERGLQPSDLIAALRGVVNPGHA